MGGGASTPSVRRALGTSVAVVLASAVVSLFLVDGDDGRFDAADAAACGRDLATHVGMAPMAASSRWEGRVWRVSVVTDAGTLSLVVRLDGEVLEAARVGLGGTEALDREDRLAIFERGC